MHIQQKQSLIFKKRIQKIAFPFFTCNILEKNY